MSLNRNVVYISDDIKYSKDEFILPSHYYSTIDHILIPQGLVYDRVEKLASIIVNDHIGKPIHLVCILKGGGIFFHELISSIRKIHSLTPNHVPFTVDYIRAKSYEGTESSGSVSITGGDLHDMKGRHVILVEDIIDTGITMTQLIPVLQQQEPLSVKVTTLLEKRTTRNTSGFLADYAAFSIPDRFVIGYGMDYNEVYRDLGPICVINDEGIQKYASSSH